MAAWLTYLRERFPLPVYLLLVSGLVASGALFSSSRIDWQPATISFVGLMIFFAVLRLMDELKDLEKDKIAHPERPLPRGIITVNQAEQAVSIAAAFMLLWALCSALITNYAAGACYAIVTAYLWLMYREFYCGTWLEQRPLLYAVTHQLILVPLAYFSVLLTSPELLTSADTLYFSLPLIGAFFGYEVCRKLDPQAHPVLRTYLHTHGRVGSLLIVSAAMLIAGTGAWLLELSTVLWPFEIALLLSMTLIWLRPDAFKITEGVAGLCLIAHLWAIPVKVLWSSL